jgi:membrane-bound lytic murein transglycosylase D
MIRFCFIHIFFVSSITVAKASIKYNSTDTLKDSNISKQNFIISFTNQVIANNTFKIPLNPQAITFVQDYIRKQGKELEKMKTWGKPYFNLYDLILSQNNIPNQMKYLSVIESHLQANLVSWAGAVGPWQLMNDEAKRFGLKRGSLFDERTDYYQSTKAACSLMKELYIEFGNWLLVVAAYNGGVGRVRQAIAKSGSRNFWQLQYLLKEETRNHVKKFIATHYFFEGDGSVTTMTDEELKNLELSKTLQANLPEEMIANTTTIEISGRFLSVIIANYVTIGITDFNKLNPNFDKVVAEGKKYNLRLPFAAMKIFEEKKQEILLLSIRTLLNGQ